MQKQPHFWPLRFYIYQHCTGITHSLRLGLPEIEKEERERIENAEAHTESRARQFGVYQKLWVLPLYLYRPDIHSVRLDKEFFHGIPTSTCFFSLGCRFVILERAEGSPRIIRKNIK